MTCRDVIRAQAAELRRLRAELAAQRDFTLRVSEKLYLCFEVLQRLAERRAKR